MRAFFRVDASDSIGTGHVTRCLSLAVALRQRGVEVVFISQHLMGNMHKAVISAGFEQRVLPERLILGTGDEIDVRNSNASVQDAASTIRSLDRQRPDWLIVDHYAIDYEWESLLKPHVDSILVIDDLANRSHQCDVLLDQNFSSIGEQRYVDLVHRDTRLLCGPRYALLQPDFARYRAILDRQRSDQPRALVSFGGSDRDNLTGLTLEAFLAPDLTDIAIDVAIGRNNPHRDRLERVIAECPSARAYIAPESLAPLMAKADFSVGAGGTTIWERLCLDLPSIVVGLAENQLPTCESLHAAGRIEYLGHYRGLELSDIRKAIRLVVERLKASEDRPPEPLVDGLGAERVAEVMVPSALGTQVLRPATNWDIDSYFWWINDPETSLRARPNASISWIEHQRKFKEDIADPDSLMMVLEACRLPIGQISFDISQGHAVLDYTLDSIARGRGLEPTLVRKGLEHLSRRTPVLLSENGRSHRGTLGATSATFGLDPGLKDKPISGLRISIVSDADSWINDPLVALYLGWIKDGHRVTWCHDVDQASSGDLCFFLSCGQVASAEALARFKHNLVVHESALPLGRGWSPLTWQILGGSSRVTVTLFEAHSQIDSGDIYAQQNIDFDGTELINELRDAQAATTIGLCRDFVRNYPRSAMLGRAQAGEETRYRRRAPGDSALEPHLSLAEQFDLLRVVDNYRYPATLHIRGADYRIAINRITE